MNKEIYKSLLAFCPYCELFLEDEYYQQRKGHCHGCGRFMFKPELIEDNPCSNCKDNMNLSGQNLRQGGFYCNYCTDSLFDNVEDYE